VGGGKRGNPCTTANLAHSSFCQLEKKGKKECIKKKIIDRIANCWAKSDQDIVRTGNPGKGEHEANILSL